MVSDKMNQIKKVLKYLSKIFIIRKIKSSHIFITFDDGPHHKNTEVILDLLEKHQQKASFFLVGQEIDKHPDIAKRIFHQGHSLGYHSYSHLHAKKSGFIHTWKDLVQAKNIEKKYQISFCKRYRPPYGALTIPSLFAILLQGWKIYLWSVDSLDSYTNTDNVLAQLSAEKIRSGDVILMHDDYKSTPETLERLLFMYKSTKISLSAIK